MSANFSLSLSNPAVTSGPANVVYTNGATGNTLALILTNDFGFDLTIGGSSTGKYLLVSISANILDAAGAHNLTVAAPWTLAAVTPPTHLAAPNYYVFSLLPPAAGVPFPNGAALTIPLHNLQPSATGTGQILASYAFDTTPSDDLNVSAPLSVLAPYNPKLPALFGVGDALLLTPYVNGGDLSNPFMISSTPVSSANAVTNLLRLNLTFQQLGNNAELVPQWDSAKPPTFRISFPYFNDSSGLPAPLDLTDSFTVKDKNYNPLTSAWNFPMSLDPTNPKITQDGFWQIALDPTATVPVWKVTPTAANPHLFTRAESLSTEPGPFLDLYLLDIVSGLPIDPANPETMLTFLWNDFPGFNDGAIVYPLQKTPLTINCFQAAVVRRNNTVTLEMEWETTGTSYCQITGDAAQLATSMQNPPYRRAVTGDQPLQSSYTLTAFGPDGKTQVTRTLNCRWQLNTRIPPVSVPNGSFSVLASVDARQVYVLYDNAISFYDAETLQPLPQQPVVMPGLSVINMMVEAPNGSAVYFVSFEGKVYGFNPQTYQFTPGSGAVQGTSDSPFSIAISPDSAEVAVLMSQSTYTVGGKIYKTGDNQLALFHSADLTATQASPVPTPQTEMTLLTGPQTGNYYLALENSLEVLDPSTFKPTLGSPLNLTGTGLLAISADETALYTCSVDVTAKSFLLSKIALPSLEMQIQIPMGLGYDFFTEFLGFPGAGLEVSSDGSILFFVGLDYEALKKNQMITRFAAFDTRTLAELSWSPVSTANQFPIALSLAPDGSRLYLLAAQAVAQKAVGDLYAIDPIFV